MTMDVELRESEALETELETGTITEGIDPDYEKMRNLPKINGNTLIGDKSSAELGIRLVGEYENENIKLSIL